MSARDPQAGDDPHRAHRAAVVSTLVAAALWGLGVPAAKTLSGGFDPALLAGLLYLGMGGALALVFVALGAPAPRFSAREFGWLGVSVGLGGVIAPFLLVWGLARSPATVASLLLNAEVVLTALIARFGFGEHYTWRLFAGLLLIASGSVMLGGASAAPADLLPSLSVVSACLLWAIDNNATRQIAHADASFLGLVKGLVAGSCNTLLALATGASGPGARPLAAALAVGAVSYGLSYGLYIRGLRALGAARTGALFASAPFAGAVLAVALLGEPVSARLLLAALAMAIGVYIHLSEHRARP